MSGQYITIEPDFGRKWVGANAISLGLGLAIFAAIAEGVEQSGVIGDSGEIVGHIVGLTVAGALFGFLRWRSLRGSMRPSGWVALAAGLGLLLGYVLGFELIGFPFDYLLGPGLAAGMAAVVEWPPHGQSTRGSAWWVAANVGGFMLGGALGLVPAFLGLGESIGSTYVGWVALNGLMGGIAGAVGGAIGAAALVRMARRAPAPAAAGSQG